MAIAFDSASSASANPASSLTFAHVCASGAVLTVGAGERVRCTGVTYNAVAMTFEGEANVSVQWSGMFTMASPASGSNNIVATFASSLGCTAGGVSFTGASGVFGTYAGTTGSTSAVSLNVASATGEVVVDHVTHGNATGITQGAGQTKRWESTNNNDNAGSTEAGATSVTMSWTAGGGSIWAQSGISVQEGGGPTSSIKSIQGVAQADIKSMVGVSNANIKSVAGVDNS